MITVFMSYTHVDEELRNKLEIHLTMLKREGLIDAWYDRRIVAGSDIDAEIIGALEKAQIILLLVSPEFLASNYCFEREMTRALERNDAGDARVIPVILRPCDWLNSPLKDLLATPPDGKPVKQWADIDEAFLAVTKDIRKAVQAASGAPKHHIEKSTNSLRKSFGIIHADRSGNMRIRKVFTDRDRDAFVKEGFEYIARFLENSLAELQARYGDVQTEFLQIDARSFTTTIYRNGKVVSRGGFALGRGRTAIGDITFSSSGDTSGNSCNDCLHVREDESLLYFDTMSRNFRGERDEKLTHQGAAEHFWQILVEPLQR